MALCVAWLPGIGWAQEPWRTPDNVATIPRAELDAITARGRLVADNYNAYAHANDDFLAVGVRPGLVDSYVARRLGDGRWEIAFGRLAANEDEYRIAVRTVQKELGADDVISYEMRPPSADTAYFLRAARALKVSRRNFFVAPARPYVEMVVPADGGDEFYVYFVISPNVPGVWPHGADVRYRVSTDGRTVRERRQLHNTIMEYKVTIPPDSARMAATIHYAMHDRPEDTDVYHVLVRSPRAPALIVSKSYYFAIDLRGRILAFNRGSTP